MLLDGGGVRGLSSLLFLQALMRLINVCIKDIAETEEFHGDLKPHDVFDFVAGTSTGGLIALMLGKLGMSITEGIAQYHELSKTIFKKKHLRGKFTGGLALTRYSGKCLRKCVRKLLQDQGFGEDHPMVSQDGSDRIAW